MNDAQRHVFVNFITENNLVLHIPSILAIRQNPGYTDIWNALVQSLNFAGPPVADVSKWQKVRTIVQ